MEKVQYTNVHNIENFQAPFENGWKRELVYSKNDTKHAEVYYICPAGNRYRTKREVFQNLSNSLNINTFSFAKRPLGFKEEIVRVASAKGFKERYPTESVLQFQSESYVSISKLLISANVLLN